MSRRPAPGLALLLLAAACTSAGPGSPSGPSTLPSVSPADASVSSSAAGTHSPTPSSVSPAPTAAPALDSDPLHRLVLTDVRTGEELTLGQLAAQKPVLLETMAIWCSNCRAQMHNVVAAHGSADFHSISLDVEPGVQPDDLAAYAAREGFDWPFAMADAQLLSQLRERFGTAVANPPSMPKILFRSDGSIEMIGLGELYSAQQIADAVGG
jgi:hypothetical protein